MIKVYISDALQVITEKIDNNDIETANKMLAVVSAGIARQRSKKQNPRIIELNSKKEITYFQRVVIVDN